MQIKQLSGLEEEVMQVIWGLKEGSIRSIKEKLGSSKKLAYTTVATVVWRLYNKGMLKRYRQSSSIVYAPKVSKAEYSRNMASHFLDKMQNSFGEIALTSFAQSLETLSPEKKRYLLKLLEEHESQ